MTETWKRTLDEGLIVGVLLIDFRKAFDMINHKLLEKKLQGCGIAAQMFDIIKRIEVRTRLAVFTNRQCERDNGRLSVNSLAVIQIIRQAGVLLSKQ